VTELPGAAYFHHADSFAMMRGGRLDACVLGAYQVAFNGDLANWTTGIPDDIPAVGGAMDLAIGAKDVYVMMTLFTRTGEPKLAPRCTYRLHIRETYGISAHDLAERLGVTLFWVECREVLRRGREPGSIGTTGSRPGWPVRRRRSAG